MKNIFRFSLMLLMGVALAACSDAQTEEPAAPAGNKLIQVAPSMADFTRATDTAFEQNDEIGLFVLVNEASHIANAKFVWDGSALTADQAYYWHNDEEVAADVVAYYPYNSAWSTAGVEYNFTVNADQSTHAKYTASDLMVAQTTSKPTEQTVSLPFQHLLSKVVVTIDNQLGEEIANVWFSEVYGSTKVELGRAVILSPDGSKGTIKAAPTTTVGGEDAWALILVPQVDVEPKLIVTTVSEKQYTFTLEAPVTFSAGKYSKANITLDAKSVSTSFTPEIEDWVSDNDLNFKQDDEAGEEVVPSYPEELNWNVVGDFNNWTSFDMTYNEGIYTAEPTIYAGQGFKLRLGDDWLNEDGSNVPDRGLAWNEETQAYNTYELGVPFAVVQSGSNIVVAVSGVYTISYDVVKDMVTVVLKEEVADPEPEPEPEAGQYKVYVKGIDWSEVYIYAWDESTGTAVNFAGTWPGTLMTQTEVEGEAYWVHTMPVTAENRNFQVIFNNNNGLQTKDSVAFYLNRDLYFTVNADLVVEEIVTESEYTIYAKSTEGWTNMNIWAWTEGGANYTGGAWPGIAMTQVDVDGETYFAYTMPTAAAGQEFQVIFNNGTDQTANSAAYVLDKDYYFVATTDLVPAIEGEDQGGEDSGDQEGGEFVPQASSWALAGIYAWNDATPFMTTETAQLYVVKNVTVANAFAEFKVKVIGSWVGAVSSDITGIEANKWVLASSTVGGNTSVAVAGTYDFYYDAANNRIYLMEAGVDYTTATEQTASVKPTDDALLQTVCYVRGSIASDSAVNWNTGKAMELNTEGKYYYASFTLTTTDMFKIFNGSKWYGYNSKIVANSKVTLIDGGDMSVSVAGTYEFRWYPLTEEFEIIPETR